MISSNVLMDADATSATEPLDKRLEYETSASHKITPIWDYEEENRLRTRDSKPASTFRIYVRVSNEMKKRGTASRLIFSLTDPKDLDNEFITRYYAAESGISSSIGFFVDFLKTRNSDIIDSFDILDRSDCDSSIEVPETPEELEIERDVRFWTPPKRTILMEIEFRREDSEDASQ